MEKIVNIVKKNSLPFIFSVLFRLVVKVFLNVLQSGQAFTCHEYK